MNAMWDKCSYKSHNKACILSVLCPVRIQWEGCPLQPRRWTSPETDHAGTLILELQSPELWEINFCCSWDFLGGLDGKESACDAGDMDLIPGSGRSPGEGSGNPLQYSCLMNSMDRGAWWAIVHGVAKSWTWLSN